jgi:RNA polymerase sigma-70 factor (sigma-E family)
MGEADFESLCKEHFASVARTAFLITGDPQEAQDLAQEAFARAFERWRRVSMLDRPDAWVHRVVTNLAISSWRRTPRRERIPLPAPPEVAAPEAPDPVVLRALHSLPPAQRAAVVLRYYLDWSAVEIAKSLGKQPGTVRALTHQGLERLRQLLDEETDDERI